MTQSFSNQLARKIVCIFCLLLFFKLSSAQPELLARQINIPDYKGTAKKLIDQISQNENIVFAYSSEVSLSFKVSFQSQQIVLGVFLEILFKGKPVGYKVNGNKVLLFPDNSLFSQQSKLTQTVRGTIIDNDSKLQIIGASIIIPNTDPIIGTITDLDGLFRLQNIPIGRTTIQISYLGYETITVPNIEVNSGKEVVLDLSLRESVVKIDEVVIKANKNKGEALNEMSLLSSRSISVEESKRYTGGMQDPARVVSSFAGVTASPDGGSDIIVRGNSPKYMKWRLDGIEITSPYHMDDQNATFGAITALNNNLLATSDFYTGAFSPEYGNVLTSVMDVKLRTGNNENFEAACAIGLLGTEVTMEGPFKKGYGGSYLLNYRYSTATLLEKSGLLAIDGAPNYQDLLLKAVFPTKNSGIFSVFALGGLSGFSMKNIAPAGISVPGRIEDAAISKDYDKAAYLANLGISHTMTINSNSFIKSFLSYSANGMNDDIFEFNILKTYNSNGEYISDSATEKKQTFDSRVENSAYRGSVTYNNKINAKNKIQIGTKYTFWGSVYDQSASNSQNTPLVNVADLNKSTSIINNFISWKHIVNEKFFILAGLHNMNILLNEKSTLEPRIAINWQINSTNSVHAGYGKHSTMESLHNYFTKVVQPNGSIVEPNKNLDLLKADHYVLGYEKNFSKNLRATVELYYQHLYNLPVENNDTSYYATINEGIAYRYVPLVNKGIGKNSGVEFTIERFFDNNYYFLINATIFDSKYKSLEGIWRNTMYNSNYLANILCGKEFKKLGEKHNKILAINAKVNFNGGQRYIPLLRDGQGSVTVDPANDRYFDYSKAYNKKLGVIFSVNLSVSYKINKSKSTQEIFLDLLNVIQSDGKLGEYYDVSKPNKIGYMKQGIFVPNIMYRVYF